MKVFISLIFLLISLFTNGQINSVIHGITKEIKYGKVYMVGIIPARKYYGNNKIFDSAEIKEGQFTIKRKVYDNRISAYRFVFRSTNINSATDFFFSNNHDLVIEIDTINIHCAPLIKSSKVQNEMRFVYNNFFREFVKEINYQTQFEDSLNLNYHNNLPNSLKLKLDSLNREISKKSDLLIFEYAKRNPSSYVTIWKLIERFYELGFKEEYLNAFNLLDEKIKKSIIGNMFHSDLKKAMDLTLGKTFPELIFNNIKLQKQILNSKYWNYDFTLIDFWFSNCSPCLKEFSLYKKIYKNYHKDGFEIIGISVDDKSNIIKWKNTIIIQKLIWPQFLDINGKVSSSFNINNFPTNFLLDKKGTVLMTNISPKELDTFLKENLIVKDANDNIFKLEPK